MTASEEGGRTTALRSVKAVHTIIWAFFVFTIGAIWVFAWTSNFVGAAWAIAVVLVETAVLALNHGRCPLGDVVARYTENRQSNFDIYLPVWLAARTKPIFGPLFAAGILFTLIRWLAAPG